MNWKLLVLCSVIFLIGNLGLFFVGRNTFLWTGLETNLTDTPILLLLLLVQSILSVVLSGQAILENIKRQG